MGGDVQVGQDSNKQVWLGANEEEVKRGGYRVVTNRSSGAVTIFESAYAR